MEEKVLLEDVKKLLDTKQYTRLRQKLKLNMTLDAEFETIAEMFRSKAGSDYAASRGEYLNGKIMANYLGFEFIDAAEVIFFDEEGNFDAEKTNNILSVRLGKVDNAVVPVRHLMVRLRPSRAVVQTSPALSYREQQGLTCMRTGRMYRASW